MIDHGFMRYAAFFLLWCLSLVSAEKSAAVVREHGHQHDRIVAGDTDCPAYRNGLKCYGFGIMDGYTVNGPKYRCSICGARWLVTTERYSTPRSPTDCPGYLNGGNGPKCYGFGMIDGVTVGGTRYKCGICGCRWITR
jgi:hypothetical protein